MFHIASFFHSARSSKATKDDDNSSVPKSMEISVSTVDGEEEFMEITTRRKTYLEVAKEAMLSSQSPLSSEIYHQNGSTPVYSIVTKKSNKIVKKPRAKLVDEGYLSYSVDLDALTYDLKKSNRYDMKFKNRKLPSYYKELKSRKVPNGVSRLHPSSSSSEVAAEGNDDDFNTAMIIDTL